jgi:hypothetical protein
VGAALHKIFLSFSADFRGVSVDSLNQLKQSETNRFAYQISLKVALAQTKTQTKWTLKITSLTALTVNLSLRVAIAIGIS